MALQSQTSLAQSSRAFVAHLIEQGLLKDGFRQILSGRNLSEVEDYILTKHLLNSDQLAEQYAGFFGLPFIHLTNLPISPAATAIIPLDIARQFKVVSYDLKGLDLYLAVGSPATLSQGAPRAIAAIRQQKGLNLHLAVAPGSEIRAVLDKLTEAANKPRVIPAADPSAQVPTDPSALHALNKRDLIGEIGEKKERKIDLHTVTIPDEVLRKIPFDVAKKYQIIVFASYDRKSTYEPPLIKVAGVNLDDLHVREILSYIEEKNKVLVIRYSTDLASFEYGLSLYNSTPVTAPIKESQPEVKPPPAEVEKQEVKVIEEKPEKAETPIEKVAVMPVAPEKAPAPPSVAVSAPAEGISISAEEIVNRPAQENSGELRQLATDTQDALNDENLDRLLHQQVNTPEDLAKIFKTGVIPEIVAAILFLGIRMKASDVHIEAERESVRIRYRVDGILHDVLRVPVFLHAPLISRIKILAKMKIDEQRVPQDGRFDVVIDHRQVDLRVSTMPTVHGEKIVMRLLDKSEGIKTLEQLGVTGTNFDTLIKNIEKPYGIILSTGPTGSGKSTTLYAILTRISRPGVNIVTLEDPVEYELVGINQAQVKPQIGFTFAEGLRSVLRQDPNVIMVGEIRDLETAGMATQSALTGHLVLSTLHTNDASGALPRLIDMGVEPYLVTSSINCVVGQRLVRRICEECREPVEIPPAVKSFVRRELSTVPGDQLKNVDLNQLVFYHGRGCPNCTNGYRGRIGIFEVLDMSEAIEELAVKKAPASELSKQAINDGMTTMIQDGFIKALKGITTVDEVMRVTTSSVGDSPSETSNSG